MEITAEQEEFLRLHIIQQQPLQKVSEQLNIPRKILSDWYEKLKPERETIANIRSVWARKKFTPDFEFFYNWHLAKERKCEYCEITEGEIERLLEHKLLETKRIVTRGRKLEFDRKLPNSEYSDLENIVLSCYWCNNAKTDTFTFQEFKEIGKSIGMVWKAKLKKLEELEKQTNPVIIKKALTGN